MLLDDAIPFLADWAFARAGLDGGQQALFSLVDDWHSLGRRIPVNVALAVMFGAPERGAAPTRGAAQGTRRARRNTKRRAGRR